MIRLVLFLFLALFCTMLVGASCGNAQTAALLRHFGLDLPFAGLGSQDAGIFAKRVERRARANPRRRFDHDGPHEGQLQPSGAGAESVVAARIEGATGAACMPE